jgi:hypothetical protein
MVMAAENALTPALQSSTAGTTALSPRDHTLILEAVITNHRALVRHLARQQGVTRGFIRGDATAALNSLLTVNTFRIDDRTKARIRVVLSALPSVEAGQRKLPDAARRSVREIRGDIAAARTIQDKIGALKQARIRGTYGSIGGLNTGIDIGVAILEDGQASIYNPGWVGAIMHPGQFGGLGEGLGELGDKLKDIVSGVLDVASDDAVSAVGAAAGEAATGGNAAKIAAAAVAGAVAGSVGSVLSE